MTRGDATDRILRAHLREMPFHRVLIRTIEASILSEVQLPRPVLDIGSGDGHFGSVLFPAGADVGLDRGLADLAEARGRGVYRLLVGADSGAMPFPDARFGSVVSNCVFEHIPDIDRTIGEISRVLKPDGVFACTVIGDRFRELLTDARTWRRLGLAAAHRAYVAWFNRKAAHFHFDSPARWTERFARAGLTVRRWRYYMSPEATRAMHRDHYLSLPHLVARKLTGRWVPFPALTDNSFWARRFRRLADEPEPEEGSCIAFVCSK
ncbi:MAG TPA: class I SAM-dependent methyltransferase [Thermoanaerobaculia bacterium]|jgi:SAM-dependent methyltransferase|nr:class I SAM-dependent methyltransferase [Thermoanaerobaculia bacterium]